MSRVLEAPHSVLGDSWPMAQLAVGKKECNLCALAVHQAEASEASVTFCHWASSLPFPLRACLKVCLWDSWISVTQ